MQFQIRRKLWLLMQKSLLNIDEILLLKEKKYMKIEIDIPDLEEIYLSGAYDETTTGKDLKEALADIAIQKFIDKIYDNYCGDKVYHSLENKVGEVVKNNSKEIVERVIERVSQEITRKKAIKDEMPKKSEITDINKEWETYFTELIDKAIAKRFR